MNTNNLCWADRETELKQIRFEIIAFAEQENVSFERALNYLMNDYEELQDGMSPVEVSVLMGISCASMRTIERTAVSKLRYITSQKNKAYKEYRNISLIEDTNLTNFSNVYDIENTTEFEPRLVPKTYYNN